MKECFYYIMLFVSIVFMTGDCDNFLVWILWELFWIGVFVFATSKLADSEEK